MVTGRMQQLDSRLTDAQHDTQRRDRTEEELKALEAGLCSLSGSSADLLLVSSTHTMPCDTPQLSINETFVSIACEILGTEDISLWIVEGKSASRALPDQVPHIAVFLFVLP